MLNLAELCEGFLPRPFTDDSVEPVEPGRMPEPFGRLLVHNEHMTRVLNEFYGEPVALEVLDHQQNGPWYRRMILLRLPSSKRIVEFGIIRLDLTAIEPAVRAEILDRSRPLGDILIRHDVLRRIEPRSYLGFRPGSPPTDYFPISPESPAYGRLGTIHCNGAAAIELLEIVTSPPDLTDKLNHRDARPS